MIRSSRQIARGMLMGLLLVGVPTGCSTVRHNAAAGRLGPYSASVSHGDLCFVSGQIGDDRSSFEAEVRSCLNKVSAELKRAGTSLDRLLSVTVYLKDMGRYAEFNRVYGELLPEPFPARACIAVADLPGGANVEVQVVAAR